MNITNINPAVRTTQTTPVCRGRLSNKTCLMLGDIQVQLNNNYKGAINKNNKFVLSSSLNTMAKRLANIFDNLYTVMERFGHGCELTFEQAEKSQKQRFFIENKASYYKLIVGDTEMPITGNIKDIESLETIEENIEKINPYEANSKFIMSKKRQADEREFIPDADYIFLEDKLIKD